jgi:predicted RecB family nuclease
LIFEGAPMTYPISVLDGITRDQIRQLKANGIRTLERLLDAAATAKKRKRLAARTNIPEGRWLAWASTADRLRIKGVGLDSAKLLQGIGVKTVRSLRYRNPQHLAERMKELNGKHKLVRLLPTEATIGRWVEEAKTLDPKIEY